MGVPNRGTSEQELARWNLAFRASPVYQEFMRSIGKSGDGRDRLSDQQVTALRAALARSGVTIPKGMHLDNYAGNLNQDNRLWRNVAIGAGIAGAAALTGGAALGAFGGAGGAAAGGAAGAAGAGAGAAATGGALATTGWVAPMAAYAAPAIASGVGTGAAVGAGAAGASSILGSTSAASGLGKWAGRAGDVAGAVGPLLGAAGVGQAEERDSQNQYAQNSDRANASNYNTQQGSILDALRLAEGGRMDRASLDLARRKFGLDATAARTTQSTQGAILANAQPYTVRGLPSRIERGTASGGLTPAMFGPENRQMGQALMKQALAGQLSGDQFDPVAETDFKGGLIPPPAVSAYQGPGGLETGLSTGSTMASILAAIAQFAQRRQQPSGRV